MGESANGKPVLAPESIKKQIAEWDLLADFCENKLLYLASGQSRTGAPSLAVSQPAGGETPTAARWSAKDNQQDGMAWPPLPL